MSTGINGGFWYKDNLGVFHPIDNAKVLNAWEILAYPSHNFSGLGNDFWANNLVVVPEITRVNQQITAINPKLFYYSNSSSYNIHSRVSGQLWACSTVTSTPFIDHGVTYEPNGSASCTYYVGIGTPPSEALTNTFIVSIHGVEIGKRNSSEIVNNCQLYQNYPNPFNPSTIIKYELKVDGFVTLRIYDILGREIKTLVNEKSNAGEHSLEFNASGLSSGIYLCYFKANDFISIKKLQLLK